MTPTTVKTPVSPKAWSAAALTLLGGIVAALCVTVLGNPHIIDALPVWGQGLIVGVLPAIASWVGVYIKRDPLRDAGAQATADYVLDPTDVAHAQEPEPATAPAPDDGQEPAGPQFVKITPEQATALAHLVSARQLPKYAESLEGFTHAE